MADIKVTRWDAAKDGEMNEENMKKKLTALGVDFKRYEFPADKTFHEHAHDVIKVDAITAGKFETTAGGVTIVLNPGDFLEMPANLKHSAKILGSDAIVLFDGTKK